MLRTLLRDESNQFRVVDDPSAISDIVDNPKMLLWLDLENPTAEEFATIKDEFNLHPLAIEDAMARHQRPKVDQYENFYLVIFYAVAIDESGNPVGAQERRGLKGSDFYRRGGDPHPNSNNGTAHSPWGTGKLDTIADDAGTLDGAQFPVPDTREPDPNANAGNERIVLHEISLFMGENYLITVHNSPVPELDEAARRWRRNAEMIVAAHIEVMDVPGTRTLTPQEHAQLKASPRSGEGTSVGGPETRASASAKADGIGILLYSLLDSIVDNYFPVIDNIVERVEDLEEQIFERYSQEAIESIFTLKKDLLALRKVLAPERDVLNVLIRRDLPIFEEHTLIYFQDVYDHVVRITDSIDTYRDLLSSALDSFLSMQSNRLNITVQTLTSVSIILMSIAAFTGWYGMNFAAMPELTSRFGYPGLIAVVAIVVILEVIFFKRRKWL